MNSFSKNPDEPVVCQTSNEHESGIHEENVSYISDCDDSVINKDYEPNLRDESYDSLNSSTEMDDQEIEQAEPNETERAGSSKKSRWQKRNLEKT